MAREYIVTQRVSGLQHWIIEASDAATAVFLIEQARRSGNDDEYALPWNIDRAGRLTAKRHKGSR